MSQCKLGFDKQVTLGEQPEGRECLGLCHPALAAALLVSVPPSLAPTPHHTLSLVFGVHKACLPVQDQLTEGEEESVVELMT